MVFNSGVFIYFFALVLAVYWTMIRMSAPRSAVNVFLLITSYYFYGYWDWMFLFLIFLSTIIDYTAGLLIEKENSPRKRKVFLSVSMISNLAILGIFKYYDFFIKSFISMSRSISPGLFPEGSDSLLLNVVLPVGISFYTFQTMSYAIDVYRKEIPAEKSFLTFALFVCFFPQLVAGPIERAKDLLTQLKEDRVFQMENMAKGAWFILLGFYMKVYVADNLAPVVDQVFLPGKQFYLSNPQLVSGHGGLQILFACFGFVMQIYCDFAGYSNIAIGTSLMLGIRLTQNFNTPEFSQNPGELWRRWHVTLNRWVTDYVYIPLGGSRISYISKQKNLLLAFMIMGLWHGANWTFVVWGFVNGAWVVLHEIIKDRVRIVPDSAPEWIKSANRVMKMLAVFFIFSLTGTFFRAYDINHSAELWKSLLTFPYSLDPVKGVPGALNYAFDIFRIVAFLLFLDIMAYRKKDQLWIFQKNLYFRTAVYIIMFLVVAVLGEFGRDVIYFAF